MIASKYLTLPLRTEAEARADIKAQREGAAAIRGGVERYGAGLSSKAPRNAENHRDQRPAEQCGRDKTDLETPERPVIQHAPDLSALLRPAPTQRTLPCARAGESTLPPQGNDSPAIQCTEGDGMSVDFEATDGH